jgi:uncharacterized protein YijF (DUF1287 family)
MPMKKTLFAFFGLLLAFPLAAQSTPSRGQRLASAAEKQIGVTLVYDPAYVRLAYPNGDVPMDRGVCTDVIIRAFRVQGCDLQKEVHEDMLRNFDKYPKNWDLTAPDSNIDHRRVPNLRVYFTRQGWSLPITNNPGDYQSGDIVTWQLSSGVPHIGIVTAELVPETKRPLMIHNIGGGAQKDDFLFGAKITGHYRQK